MSMLLSITIRFLDSRPAFHGRTDGGDPEWPPSPLRMFQSILAAAAGYWNGSQFLESAEKAFGWLEKQKAPSILAPPHQIGTPLRIAVPNNDLDIVATAWAGRREPKKQPNELKTMKALRPTYMLADEDKPATVYYLFPIPDGRCPYLDVLTAAARSITHLGWGIDMVAGDASLISEEEAEKLPGERWVPVTNSPANGYRVPVPGTLDALIRKHEAFLNRVGSDGFKPVPPLTTFGLVTYRRATDPPARRYVAFKLLHPEEDRMAWFPPSKANHVAAMTRHATACAAGGQQPEEWIDTYVHGHRNDGDETKPRFSYLPLPSIEARGEGAQVVGGIRRVIVAELTESPESRIPWARQMLPGQFLEYTGVKKAMLAPLTGSDWVLRQYVEPAETWATVTPIVLPGSDDGKFAKAEKLFFKSLRHAGYSPEALAELELRNVSFWPGGGLSLQYQRPDYLREGGRSVYHACIRWRNPITGPIAIGAGRHCGLGIFAAMRGN